MPLNFPNGNQERVSLGPAIILMGPTGTTPTVEVGYIGDEGISIEVATERAELRQGNPLILETAFATKQDVKVTCSGIDWNLNVLAGAIGAGSTNFSAAGQTFSFGGMPYLDEVALYAKHVTPAGITHHWYFWRCIGSGGVKFDYGQEIHKRPYSWDVMRATTNWAGATLSSNQQMFACFFEGQT